MERRKNWNRPWCRVMRPPISLLSLFADRDGALWVGVESRGLLRRQGGKMFLYTATHGLPFLSAGGFLEDGG